MVLALLFVVCLPGFSQQALAVEIEGISLLGLPAPVQEGVKRKFPGASISEIDDGESDGTAVYEIEGSATITLTVQ